MEKANQKSPIEEAIKFVKAGQIIYVSPERIWVMEGAKIVKVWVFKKFEKKEKS